MVQQETKRLNWIRFGSLALAAVGILLGLMREENLTVLKKAINICLECIGIG